MCLMCLIVVGDIVVNYSLLLDLRFFCGVK